MKLIKLAAAAAIVASLAAPAARAGEAPAAPEGGCLAVAAANYACTYVARTRGGIYGAGDFYVRIQRGRRLIQLHSYDLIPHLEAQKIRAGDRVTLYSWMGGICRVPTASFVRAGSEQALIWGF